MAEVIELDEYRIHKVSHLICKNCHYDWVAVYLSTLEITDLYCPSCDSQTIVSLNLKEALDSIFELRLKIFNLNNM
jgi:transposase-like protein